jgi:G:T-mismatch repair DNA endonuclease (very short patch repair protein)
MYKIHKPNCQCISCKYKRGEQHKFTCQCCCCKGHRGETKGEDSYWYGKKLNHKPNCPCCICKSKRGETKGKNSSVYGKHWNLLGETIRKMKKNRKGMSGKHHTEEAIQKMIKSHTGKHPTEETIRKMRKPKSEEIKKKDRIAGKKRWQNPRYREKQLTAMFKGLDIKPNKPEQLLNKLLQELFPNEYKYVGDGSVIIGYKNPDFINVNGQKKIIELYGDYWHRNDNPQKRIDLFSKHGYQTLIIWEHELKDIEKLRTKLERFNAR